MLKHLKLFIANKSKIKKRNIKILAYIVNKIYFFITRFFFGSELLIAQFQ